MKNFKSLLLTAIILFFWTISFSQSYQVVWADEFTTAKSSDWVYETGCSFPNRELECYTTTNDVVIDGKLHIQARRETDGRLTSSRMITRSKKTWTYGKFEMYASLPCFKGSWPAFWLLGESYQWPGCGEIDIFEQTNTSNWIQGNYIWPGLSMNAKGTTPTFSLQQFHKYTLEWTPSTLKYYLDDVLYHTGNISTNGIFQKPFFMLINLAIGGDMTGIWDKNAIDLQVGTSKDFVIDYIRVYQLKNGPSVTITSPASTSSTVIGSTAVIKGTAVPETGKTISKVEVNIDGITYTATGTTAWSYDWVTSTAGSHTIKVKAYSSSSLTDEKTITLNVISPVAVPAKIEAENYSAMFGIQTETTTDTGAGLDVGYTDAGDYLDYFVNVPTTGIYNFDFRLASAVTTGRIEIRNQAGTALASLAQGSTGGWQVWVTKTVSATLTAGAQTLRIYYVGAGLNINWIEIKPVDGLVLTTIELTPLTSTIIFGQTQQYTAVGKDQNGNPMAITPTWSAIGGAISTSGLYTGSTAGTFTVKATSGIVSGTASITVNPLVLTAIEVTPAIATIVAGQTQQFAIIGKDQLGNVMAYTPTWSTTGGSISTSGLFTASTSGTFTIKATSGTISGSASVTVNPAVPTTIAITPTTSTINVGQSVQFAVVVKDQNANVMAITPTWTTTGGSISATGLFPGLTEGTYTVTASVGTLSATATVTVNKVTVDPLTASYFQIVNKWTADYMRPTDGLATAAITQYESATVPTMSSFQWEFRTATTAGYYYIINRWTGNAIQPTGASVAENAGLSQVALTTANQNNTELQWAITASDEAGFYWIKNRKSGLSIRPTNGTNGTGIAIVQNALNTTYSSFKWKFANQTLKSAIIDGAEISGQGFKIYPNPTTDKLNVEMKSVSFTQLNIYTVSGMKVYSQSVSGMQSVQIDLSSYKKGMYFISLSGDGIQSERFVVK
jgi:beta-glucanase (GH16 family)